MLFRPEDHTPAQKVIAALSGAERQALRAEKGLSRNALARVVGITVGTAANWERAGATPSPVYAIRYCRALGLKVPAK